MDGSSRLKPPTAVMQRSTTRTLRYRVMEAIRVGHGPMGVAAAFGSIWVANHEEDTVSRIDPRIARVVATIRVGNGPGHLVPGYGSLWVSDDKDAFLWRIDPRTNSATRVAAGGRIACVPAAGLGTIWFTVWDPATLVAVDPATATVIARLRVDSQPLGVQVAGGSLWVASAEGGGHLLRIDAATGRITARLSVLSDWSWLQGYSVGAGSLWVANPFVQTVARVDVRTNALVAVLPVGYVNVATFADGALWVADVNRTLLRIDPETYRTTDTIRVGTSLGGVASGFGSIWVTNYSDDALSRIALSPEPSA